MKQENTFLFVSNLDVRSQLQYFYSVLEKEEAVHGHAIKGNFSGVLE